MFCATYDSTNNDVDGQDEVVCSTGDHLPALFVRGGPSPWGSVRTGQRWGNWKLSLLTKQHASSNILFLSIAIHCYLANDLNATKLLQEVSEWLYTWSRANQISRLYLCLRFFCWRSIQKDSGSFYGRTWPIYSSRAINGLASRVQYGKRVNKSFFPLYVNLSNFSQRTNSYTLSTPFLNSFKPQTLRLVAPAIRPTPHGECLHSIVTDAQVAEISSYQTQGIDLLQTHR